jgi:sigma-E factor negative regulatory protein RseC
MIEQQGKVVDVVKDRACVRLGGATGCARCDSGRGCGAGVFGRLLKRKPVVLELENHVDAGPGQPVMVGIPENLFLRLVCKLYLYPLLGGLAGAVIAHYLSAPWSSAAWVSDLAVLVGGLAAGAAVVLWNRKNSMEFPTGNIVHLLRIVELHESGK